MKILFFILSFLFLSNPVPSFAASADTVQGGPAVPYFYSPENPVQEGTAMQSGPRLDFGNYTSNVLLQKAWASLSTHDLKAVEAYVNKINELYAGKAKEMQGTLQDYASGSNDNIFKYWALNDVSTAWFVLGEAYRMAGKKDEAIQAYNKVINEFSYGQCWDSRGWFWKPARAAQEKTDMIRAGLDLDFGDYSSSTLTQRAWSSLAQNDLKSVQAYVDKINELYAGKAKEMQAGLQGYASGSNDQISKYWALNDVGTSVFILGEAYHMAGNKEKAAEAFNTVINDYSFAQCWDQHGWFWKPAVAAKDNLDLIKAGINLDFGDYSSNTLVQKAWAALAAKDLRAVKACVDKVVELYGSRAKEMQSSLKGYTWPSLGPKEKVFSYWALNDVGTALFILGEAYRDAGKNEEASRAYKMIINEYSYAQCWDPQGWFWNPSEAAQQRLAEVDIS